MNLNDNNELFVDKLYCYINSFNDIIELIHKNNNITKEMIINKIKFKKFIIKQILIIENNICLEDITEANINKLFDEYLVKLIYEVKNRTYYNKFKFVFIKDTISEKYHMTNIREEHIHPLLDINTYDIEVYKFYNRLDEYKEILGVKNSELGNISITYYKNYYKITRDSYIDYNKQSYYIKNNIKDIKNLCKNFITGILWNFDFYFNKYNKYNTNNICTWCYTDNIAPFITDLYNYLLEINSKDFDNIFTSINNEF